MTKMLKDILNEKLSNDGFEFNETLSTKQMVVLDGDVGSLANRQGHWLFVPQDEGKKHCAYNSRNTILHGVVPIDDTESFEFTGKKSFGSNAPEIVSTKDKGEDYFVLPGEACFGIKLVELLQSAGLIAGIDYRDISDRDGDFSVTPFFRWTAGKAPEHFMSYAMGSKGALDLSVYSLRKDEKKGLVRNSSPGEVGEMNAKTKEIARHGDQHLGLSLTYTFKRVLEGVDKDAVTPLLTIASHLRAYMTGEMDNTIGIYAARDSGLIAPDLTVNLPFAALFYDKEWVVENLTDAVTSIADNEEFAEANAFFKEMKSADWFGRYNTPLINSVVAANGDLDKATAMLVAKNPETELSRVNGWKQRIIADDYVPLIAALSEKVDQRLMTYFDKLC